MTNLQFKLQQMMISTIFSFAYRAQSGNKKIIELTDLKSTKLTEYIKELTGIYFENSYDRKMFYETFLNYLISEKLLDFEYPFGRFHFVNGKLFLMLNLIKLQPSIPITLERIHITSIEEL